MPWLTPIDTPLNMTERVLTGASGHFSAAHNGPDGLHGHTWEVRAWFECSHRSDAICAKAALDAILKQWDHTTLADELAWGEDIARAVGTLANCVEVEVSRPLEGFHAKWISS